MLLFATAVASVATVQLARVARRKREMTVRAALGASTARLARQWLTESVVIGVAGGALGIAAAKSIIAALPAILPADFPRLSDITLDWRVGFASSSGDAGGDRHLRSRACASGATHRSRAVAR